MVISGEIFRNKAGDCLNPGITHFLLQLHVGKVLRRQRTSFTYCECLKVFALKTIISNGTEGI